MIASVKKPKRHTLVQRAKLQRLNGEHDVKRWIWPQALKGDGKQQGNWGAVVLARVLADLTARPRISNSSEPTKRCWQALPTGRDRAFAYRNKLGGGGFEMALVAFLRLLQRWGRSATRAALRDHLGFTARAHIKAWGQRIIISSKVYRALIMYWCLFR